MNNLNAAFIIRPCLEWVIVLYLLPYHLFKQLCGTDSPLLQMTTYRKTQKSNFKS